MLHFSRRLPQFLTWLLLAALPSIAHADLQDEIQVYDDAINAPGEFGVELHANTTPSGRATPEYRGELTPHHGLRLTPEFAWGLSQTLEAGLYLPSASDAQGRWRLAGLKLRLKWLPWQTQDGRGGFGGVNLELSRVGARYAAVRSALEARFIAGWRSAEWLAVLNPTLGKGLSDAASHDPVELRWGLKLSRRVAEGLSLGPELYAAPGSLARTLPWRQQDNRLYLALDLDRKPWVMNLGLGRGLTDAADRWTVKAIFELPV